VNPDATGGAYYLDPQLRVPEHFAIVDRAPAWVWSWWRRACGPSCGRRASCSPGAPSALDCGSSSYGLPPSVHTVSGGGRKGCSCCYRSPRCLRHTGVSTFSATPTHPARRGNPPPRAGKAAHHAIPEVPIRRDLQMASGPARTSVVWPSIESAPNSRLRPHHHLPAGAFPIKT
jgi:hypothetical protein